MRSLAWLDLVDPGMRRGLLGLTVASLAVGTVLLEQVPQPVWVLDLVALGWLAGLLAVWFGVRWRARPRIRAQRRADAERREAELHERGLLVGGAVPDGYGGLVRLALEDPSFSLPAAVEWAWRLYLAAQEGRDLPWLEVQSPLGQGLPHLAGARVLGVHRHQGRVGLHIVLLTGEGDRIVPMALTLERPPGAHSRPVDDLADLDRPDHGDDWHLTDARAVPPPAPARPAAGLPAALRALCASNDTVVPDAIEERVRELAQELEAGDTTRLASRCTATGVACLAAPRALGDDDGITWLDAGTDTRWERVALRHRGVDWHLLRLAGTDDGWRPWLLVGGTP